MVDEDYIEYVVDMKKQLQKIAERDRMDTRDGLLLMALDFIITKELYAIYEENEENETQ